MIQSLSSLALAGQRLRAGSWVLLVAGALATLGALSLAGCGPPGAPAQEVKGLRVAASIYPLAYFAGQIGGDLVEVITLVPPGAEAHTWEPSPRDVATLQQASLFLYNGAGFEPWVPRALASAQPTRVEVVEVTRGMPLVEAGGGSGGPPDPHVWLDPLLAEGLVEAIQEALARVDPAQRTAYQARARTLTARLESLHEAFLAGLATCQIRTVIASHAFLGYLAHRYRLEVVAIAGLSPEAEPSPARLAEVVRTARELGIGHIFFESLSSPALPQVIAREVGAKLLVFNPLEGLTKVELAAGEDYFTVMHRNLENLKLALGCQ